MFEIFGLAVFYTYCKIVFIICPHAKFQIPSSNGPLVTDIKSKAKRAF